MTDPIRVLAEAGVGILRLALQRMPYLDLGHWYQVQTGQVLLSGATPTIELTPSVPMLLSNIGWDVFDPGDVGGLVADAGVTRVSIGAEAVYEAVGGSPLPRLNRGTAGGRPAYADGATFLGMRSYYKVQKQQSLKFACINTSADPRVVNVWAIGYVPTAGGLLQWLAGAE